MRHQVAVRKLGRTSSHRRAMLRNMVTSLLLHERIRTTTPKAKVARRFADRMITFGKKGTLHARRQAARFINDETVLKKLFDEIAPAMADRKGGYTRIMRTGVRKGDAADTAILELVTKVGGRSKKKNNRKSELRLAKYELGGSEPAQKKQAAAATKTSTEVEELSDVTGDVEEKGSETESS